MKRKLKASEKIWIGIFISLWMIVSTVSTFHSIQFFQLSNNEFLSWLLGISFELGAIASLGGLLVSRGSKTLIWMLFIILTLFQIHCNMYWCWINANDITEWVNMLDLFNEDEIFQRRIFAIISGGILPVISLGFMKSLLDYLNPDKLKDEEENKVEDNLQEENILKDTNDKNIVIEDDNSDTTIDQTNNEVDVFNKEDSQEDEEVDDSIDNNIEVEIQRVEESSNNVFWNDIKNKNNNELFDSLDEKFK